MTPKFDKSLAISDASCNMMTGSPVNPSCNMMTSSPAIKSWIVHHCKVPRIVQGWGKSWRCYHVGDKFVTAWICKLIDECAYVELQVCVDGACGMWLHNGEVCVEDKPGLGGSKERHSTASYETS